MIGLTTSEQIEFTFYEEKCPHCQEHVVFQLWKKTAKTLLGSNIEYLIRCSGCKYDFVIDNDNYAAFKELGEEYERYRNGIVPDQEFYRFAENLQLPELQKLHKEAETWNCSCGEENPTNFEVCWNCGEKTDIEVTPSTNDGIDLKARHPWEN